MSRRCPSVRSKQAQLTGNATGATSRQTRQWNKHRTRRTKCRQGIVQAIRRPYSRSTFSPEIAISSRQYVQRRRSQYRSTALARCGETDGVIEHGMDEERQQELGRPHMLHAEHRMVGHCNNKEECSMVYGESDQLIVLGGRASRPQGEGAEATRSRQRKK